MNNTIPPWARPPNLAPVDVSKLETMAVAVACQMQEHETTQSDLVHLGMLQRSIDSATDRYPVRVCFNPSAMREIRAAA